MGFTEEGLTKHLLLIQIPRQTDRQICKFSKTFELNVSFHSAMTGQNLQKVVERQQG